MPTSKAIARRFAALVVGALMVHGCDGGGPSEPPPPTLTPASIVLLSGDGQTASPGAAFAQPLVVKVAAASGAGVPGVSVTFQVTGGSGSASPGTAMTDSVGRAQTTVTAGAAPGPLVITASVAGLSQTAVANATVQLVIAQLAGRWRGTTGQTETITLWVGSGVVDSLRVVINVDVVPGFSYCSVTFTPAGIALGSDGRFTATLSSSSGVSGTLSGAFGSASVSGTLQAGWSGAIQCGSTLTIGSGGSSGLKTWQATRSPLGVSSVSPNNGALAGGTNVTINGWFETAVDSVRIGTARLGNLVRVSNTQITGTTPAGTATGGTSVTAYAGTASSSCSFCFTYNALPTVSGVSPTGGSTYGGSTVTITGTGFPATIDSVRLGSARLSNVVRSSSTQIRGVTPAVAVVGAVDLVVHTTTAGNATCVGCFTYTTPGPVAVSTVSPSSGPVAGGTSVAITGADFPPVIDSVRFGSGLLGSVVRVSGTQLTGVTPVAGVAGAVNVTVYTTSAGGNGTCSSCFTYNPPMTLTGVSPASGRLASGTFVTIAGTNFPATGVDSVRFGTGRLTSVVRVSATQLSGFTPAGTALGPVDVTVFAASAGVASCAGCFTYTWAVAAVSPSSGPVAGGTNVTVTGTNFPATVDSVRFGSVLLGSVARVSATQLTGVTPASAAGAVTVAVYSAGSGGVGCTACFTFNPPITVTGVSPATGSTDGRLPITITGTNFPATIDSVRFGAARLGNVVRVSGTQIIGVVPAGSLGAVDVTVFTASAGNGSCSGCFTYTAPVSWARLMTGGSHTCAFTSGGTAYCWGYNFNGAVGDSSTTDRAVAARVAGGLTFASMIPGGSHTCALTAGGTAYCWGQNNVGQLGIGSFFNTRTTPTAVNTGLTFSSLAAGGSHTCGLTAGGAAYCWGGGFYGQLGDSGTSNHALPVAVRGGLTFTSLTAGADHSCGLTAGGIAYCWGRNGLGQLGDGTTTDRLTPVAVAGGLTFVALAARETHMCGLTGAGVAYCWGTNTYGQLGDGSTANRSVPTAVTGGLTFASVTTGGSHTCGLTGGGAVFCWGVNFYGQLGDGTNTNRSTPTAIAGGLTFASLAAGGGHNCGMTSGGAAYCWGNNTDGQVGDGTFTSRNAPVAVVSP